ncbi:unnamed protein product [Mytilus coruscus]|uniref:F-box domain-containing protein n=1 Tax=Mytilus coruscus TaxID=42192 RepID=A0A6J8AH25_MYTCO|nr:unnamed protein product [Mytilus coruscus]
MTEKDNCHLLSILNLPDVPLIRIFFFLDLEDFVLVVNRVCKRFYHLIKSTPVLWRVFEFYWPQTIKEEDILNPTTSSTCSNELQSDSTDNIIYTAIALPNENETIVSRNAEDFDTIEQIDEVSSHQGEEEQNEDTIEEQNVETSCDTNANDETMRSRKRKRQSELWKQNLRKRRRQSGVQSNKLINQFSEDLKMKYELHIVGKSNSKVERDNDRSSKKAVLCFDMENGITCPRANISNVFYKRKLNVFNLTGHLSLNKCAYNAVWSEHIADRGANEI